MYKKWPYDKKFQNNFFLVFSNLQTKNWKEKCQKDGQFLDKHTCQSFDFYMYFNGKMLILSKCFFSTKTL